MGSGIMKTGWWKWPEIYLASTSVQRASILKELDIPFKVLEMEVNEIIGTSPEETVMENAKRKAVAGIRAIEHCENAILAADTVLAMEGKIYGKPSSPEEAKKTLEKFSGKCIRVFTGVAGVQKQEKIGIVALEMAEIEFHPLTSGIIDWYISTGEPLTRAGSIGISRIGEILIKSTNGSFSCIAGLPKNAVLAVLTSLLQTQNPINLISPELISPMQFEHFTCDKNE